MSSKKLPHPSRLRFSIPRVVSSLVIPIFVTALCLGASAPKLPWTRSLDKAIRLAREQNKLIIADLYTSWCIWCVVMDHKTFGHPSVIEQMGPRYVWLRLNTETEEDGIEAQRRFRVLSYPTTLVIEPEEQLYERIAGFVPPDRFHDVITQHSHKLRQVIELRKRVQRHPEDVQLKQQLAREYAERREFGLAAEIFQALVEGKPFEGLDECYYWLGLCLAGDGKEKQGLDYLIRLIDRFPGSQFVADALALQGQIHFNLDEMSKAGQLWRTYLNRFPDHPIAPNIRDLLKKVE